MRLLLIFLLASVTWAQTGIMRVQRRATGGGGSPPSAGVADSKDCFTNSCQTDGVLHSSGDGIFCIATWDGFTGTATFTNTASDTWNALDTWNDSNSFQRFSTAYVKSSAGNATDRVTVSLSVTPSTVALSCLSFTGHNPTTPLDQHVTGESDASATVTSSAFTTTTANELIIAGFGKYTGAPTWDSATIGGSAATIPSGATSAFKFVSLAYRTVTATQTGITASATASANGTAMGIGVATFK
jgi:hypothetical protein